MERKLIEVDNDIQQMQLRRQRATEELAHVTHRLLLLGSERLSVIHRNADRRLYLVPEIIESSDYPDVPDGVA